MFIDAHCHLDQLDDPDAAVAAARAAGVGRIVAVSQDLPSMQAVLKLKARHPDLVLAGLGIHPQLMPSMEDARLEEAFAFLEAHVAAADVIGEIGLDYKHAATEESQARQGRWLDRLLALAADHRKPVNLHSRRALRQVMERAIAFQQASGCPAQLHWFTHSRKLIRITNQTGVYVSVGPATLLSADTLAVAASIAPDLLLTETDSPVPFGGESARPDWIGRVVALLAREHGLATDALAQQIAANFDRMLAGIVPVRG